MAGTLFSKAMVEFVINTQNALQQLNGFQQKFSNGIGQMKSLLVGFIGFQGLRGAYNSLTDLVDVANKWNIPVERVSEFTNLFTQFGGSAEEAVASLDKFQQMANQLRFHSSGPLRELSAVLRTNLGNKDYMGVINAIRSQWGQLNSEARAEVQNMLGVDSDAMRRMLAASNEEFAEALKNSEKFGKLTGENAKSLFEMRKALAETKLVLTQLAVPILEFLTPILKWLRDAVMWINQLPDGVKKFIPYMLAAGYAIKAAGLGLKGMHGWMLVLLPLAYKLGQKFGKWAMDLKDWANRSDAKLRIQMGNGDGNDVAVLRGYLNRNRDNLDAETIKKYEDLIAKAEGNIRNKPEYWGYIKDVAKNYSTPVPASNTKNQSYVDNKSQTINIYGVKNAEDIIPALRSVAMQNISPIQGY